MRHVVARRFAAMRSVKRCVLLRKRWDRRCSPTALLSGQTGPPIPVEGSDMDNDAAMLQALKALSEKLDAVHADLMNLTGEMEKERAVTREGLALVASSTQELARSIEGKEHAGRWRAWNHHIDEYVQNGSWNRGDSTDGHWHPSE
jgi:hypothetical protein